MRRAKVMDERHQIRRCVACGEREAKELLVRIIAAPVQTEGGGLMIDEAKREKCRSAYMHRQCAEHLAELSSGKQWGKVTSPQLWERALRLGSGKLKREDIVEIFKRVADSAIAAPAERTKNVED